MLEGETVKESVVAAMSQGEETTPAEATPAPVVEDAPSPEVKVEETSEVKKEEVVEKTPDLSDVAPVVDDILAPGGEARQTEVKKEVDKDQINNLNKALSIERDARKKLEEELGSVKPVFDKMKTVFAPEEVIEETPEVISEEEKFEQWYKQKEEKKAEENSQQETQELIKTQITTLTTEWNGEGGKPKYDDNEVYKWQKDNQKEYLTPEEAFTIMKKDDIIDWHARNTIGKAPADVGGERPSGNSSEHAPTKTTPKTDQEIKNAVLEAMSSVE